MANDKYNIDDILKEVNTRRSSDTDGDDDDIKIPAPRSEREPEPRTARSGRSGASEVGSVTEILNSTEIDRAMRATGAQRRKEQPRSAKQKSSMSVTQILNSDDLKRSASARQLTDEESEARIARDIARAADEKRKHSILDDDDDAFFSQGSRSKSRSDSGDGDDDDYIKLFVKQDKPEQADDIVFHEPGAVVTTDTMQLRKQKKINDINKALLRIDSESDDPDDMLDSINPMESKQKAAEIVKNGESTNEFLMANGSTDTFTASNFEIKRSEDNVKEYAPSGVPQPRGRRDATDSVPFTGIQQSAVSAEIHLGDSIIDALNKKIAEEVDIPRADEVPEALRQEIIKDVKPDAPSLRKPEPVPEKTDENLEKIKRANELAQKKKRRIASFILENHDTEEIAPPRETYDDDDYEDEADEETVDLDDESVIRDRLDRASKGLFSRLIILAVLFGITLFIALVNLLNLDVGFLNKIINRYTATDYYLYTHLTIGILSFSACSSVISNGFSRLIRLRPDGDTLCAFAHVAGLVVMVPYLANPFYVVMDYSEVYLLVTLASLLCNTVSKICTVNTAKRNYDFVFAKRAKYFISRCDKENEALLTKSTGAGFPKLGAIRKTEMLCDFIVSTYCEDASDRMSRKLVPITCGAAVAGALAAFLAHTANETGAAVSTGNRLNWALTVMTAIFAIGASFSSSMTVTLPMLLTSFGNKKRGAAILGYNAVNQLSELNGVLVDARTLLPSNSVKITNICGYDKPKNRGEGKINIDEAIIYAASLAMASDSIMADAFFGMLNRKRELLKEVSGCVYESNLGVMGWIDRQRVLLGNRRHMKSHEITVPNLKKETAANVDNDEVIYLAVGGEVCLLFFVKMVPDPVIKQNVQYLADCGVSLIVKTVDGMITDAELSEQFDIEANKVHILPFEAHEVFGDCTRFVPRGSAAVACTGSFTSFAGAVRTAHTLKTKTFISNAVQFGGVVLGMLLAIIFGIFANFSMFSPMVILLYNAVFGIAALSAQFFRN